ncbi:MAG: hypothetical protein ABMA13_17020 [Chthoniobacteraceae bacterium]
MPDEFTYDVFLSHSANDEAVVRPLAERLRKEGLVAASQRSTLNSQPHDGTGRSWSPGRSKCRGIMPFATR